MNKLNLGRVKGDKGDKGDVGPQGPQGPQGPPGFAIISKAEAEAGDSTEPRTFTAQRVRQAIVAWFNGISGALGRTILTRTTAAQVRGDIGLGTAATRNVGTASGNVMQVGAFGVGASNTTNWTDAEESNDGISTALSNISGLTGLPSGFAQARTTKVNFGHGSYRSVLLAQRGNRLAFFSEPGGGPVNYVEIHHTGNILQTTGTSTEFPMSQKAVTDALNGVSDMRDKKDSQEFGIGLELIEELDVIKYKLNKRDWYRAQEAKKTKIVTQTDADGNETTEEVEEVDADLLAKPLTDYDANDGSLARDDYYTGMSAQAVKAKLAELGMSDFGLVKKYDEEYEGGEDRYYIEQFGLLPFLINSVKQLSAQNKALVERVELLEGK